MQRARRTVGAASALPRRVTVRATLTAGSSLSAVAKNRRGPSALTVSTLCLTIAGMESSELPYISIDIPWTAIRGLALRVCEYVPLAKSRDGTDPMGRRHVKALGGHPYAFLEVESTEQRPAPWGAGTALFPVAHREDFRAVETAMSIVDDAHDVIVCHKPIRFPWYMPMKGSMPTMVVYVMLKDQERREGETARDYLVRIFPLWTYEPLVERFQGRWTYVGE